MHQDLHYVTLYFFIHVCILYHAGLSLPTTVFRDAATLRVEVRISQNLYSYSLNGSPRGFFFCLADAYLLSWSENAGQVINIGLSLSHRSHPPLEGVPEWN